MIDAHRLSALFAAALLLCAHAVRADWTGTLRIRTEPAAPGPRGGNQDGKISGKGTKMRMDIAGPPQMGPMTIVVDMKAKTSLMVLDQKKAFVRHALGAEGARGGRGPGDRAPVLCDTDDGPECLRKNGFAKTGSETVNGVKADKWEKDKPDAQAQVHETMWIPQGVKDFALVRQVTKRGDRVMTLDVLDFQKTKLPDAQFEAPAGYTEMQGFGEMMGR